MAVLACEKTNQSPTWGIVDLFLWKLAPKRVGGGIAYIQRFKDAWIQYNKASIRVTAARHAFPPELLAGVCWIEVGGDPSFIDRVAFELRAFDWSGPSQVDKALTTLSHPAKTSFGAVSMQLRTAAQTFGLDPYGMSVSQLRALAECLQKDVFNVELAGKHLRQLIDYDGLQSDPPRLSMDEIKIVGARYNRGIGVSLEEIKKNTSYGDFIARLWPRFNQLLR